MNALVKVVTDNASTILTVAGMGAMGASTVLAAKAAPGAKLKIDALKEERREGVVATQDEDGNEIVEEIKLNLIDYVKTCWIDFAPTAIALGVGVACILVARHIDAAKIVALTSAAKYAQEKLEKHQKALNALDEKTRVEVEKAVDNVLVKEAGNVPPWADDLDGKVWEEDPETGDIVPITDVDGVDMLCLDSLSGQYFRSNSDKIQRAVTSFTKDTMKWNTGIYGVPYGTVGDFFDYLGLQTSNLFNNMGWTDERPLDVYFTSTLTQHGDIPVLVLKYRYQPKLMDDLGIF